ncbi:MAG: transposase [Solirubrobacteraceae bacterium]
MATSLGHACDGVWSGGDVRCRPAGAAVAGGLVFALLAECRHRIVRDEDFAECYSSRMGRPSIRPSLLAKVMLLQHRTGLSDEAAMEAWPGICAGRSRSVRRSIRLASADVVDQVPGALLLHGKEQLALENTLRLAEEIGLLQGAAEQIIDSTPMLGAAATQDTVRLVRHGVRKLLDVVGAVDQDAGRRLGDGLEFDYARPGDKPDCRWREKAARERMLTRVAQDAERALRAVEQADDLLADERVADAHRLLRELIGQDFDIDSGGVPRLHRGTASGRIISTVDTEMRHGRKSQHQRFDGYKLSAMATNDHEPLITAIGVAPASEQDGPQAKHLIDAQPAARRPKRVLGDTAYGTGPVRAELADREVDVLAPVPEAPGKDGRLAKRDFSIDLAAGTVTCPAGQTAEVRTEPSGKRRARFAKAACDRCPLRERCVAPVRGNRTILLAPDEHLLIAARHALDDPASAEHLRRTRPRIERLLGLLAVRYGARKSRYFGRAKARMQAAWAAALVNLNPIARHLAAQTA